MASTYEDRGVSTNKEEVHTAIEVLAPGIFENTFAKVIEDYFDNDETKCLVMSSDGTGTKIILSVMQEEATRNTKVWKNAPVDGIVMNLDDLLCVGATGPFIMSMSINRNKNLISGKALSEIIAGAQEFCVKMTELGIPIIYQGGETADVADTVRTITLDVTLATKMNRKDVININVKPGMVAVGLFSNGQANYEDTENSGISANGLTNARHDVLNGNYKIDTELYDPQMRADLVYRGNYLVTDKPAGSQLTVGELLASPTRTFAPVIKSLLSVLSVQHIGGIINITGGAHTKVLNFVDNVKIVKDRMPEIPFVFRLIQQTSKTDWQEMYEVFNMGVRMVVYVRPQHADTVISTAEAHGVGAQIIGRVEAYEGKAVQMRTPYGDFIYKPEED